MKASFGTKMLCVKAGVRILSVIYVDGKRSARLSAGHFRMSGPYMPVERSLPTSRFEVVIPSFSPFACASGASFSTPPDSSSALKAFRFLC